MLPIILIFGEAGAGKDSVAQVIVKDFNAVSVAMADPMKRFCASVFGFDKETLWGPSEKRNAIHPEFLNVGARGLNRDMLEDYYVEWLHDVLPNMSAAQGSEAEQRLFTWFDDVYNLAQRQGGLSARTALQTLGTEFGRAMDPNMWINYAQRQLMQLLAGGYTYSPEAGLTPKPGQMYSYGVCTDGRFRNECLGFKAAGATILNVRTPETTRLTAGVQGHASEQEQRTIPDSWFDYQFCNNKKEGVEVMRAHIRKLMDTFNDRVYRF